MQTKHIDNISQFMHAHVKKCMCAKILSRESISKHHLKYKQEPEFDILIVDGFDVFLFFLAISRWEST
jgi:hypothetical protein